METGTRRITLAEKLRKIPLALFGKKDLADLTSTIMADCTALETAFSHFIPPFAGSLISTVLIAVSLFFFDWRMAAASLWVLPVAYAIAVSYTHLDVYKRQQCWRQMPRQCQMRKHVGKIQRRITLWTLWYHFNDSRTVKNTHLEIFHQLLE